MSLAIPFLATSLLHAHFFQGAKKIAWSVVFLSVIIPLITFSIIYLFEFKDLDVIVSAYVVSSILAALISMSLFYFTEVRLIKSDSVKISDIYQTSLPLLVVFLASVIIQWGGQIFLGVLSSEPQDIAAFQALQKTSFLLTFVLLAVNSIAAPKISESFHKADIDSLKSTIIHTNRMLFVVSTPILIFGLIFSSEVIGIFGEGYAQYSSLLSVLLIAQYVNVNTGSIGYLLMMTGNEKSQMKSIVLAMLIMVILMIALIPKISLTGAVVALAVAVVTQNLVATYYVYRKLSLNVFYLTLGVRK